jgi:RNA polymerase subunit RPABC4/transcription elongation factor Spt4
VIPRWLAWTCATLYVVALVIVLAINFSELSLQIRPHDLADRPVLSAFALAGLVTACAAVISIWLMSLGYVYRDAKRRDMNPALWTILCMLLSWPFFAIGFILYFQVREPLPYTCPRCSTMVGARFNFCPNCKCNLHPSCPNCKREVAETDKFCPYCAQDLVLKHEAGSTIVAGTEFERSSGEP